MPTDVAQPDFDNIDAEASAEKAGKRPGRLKLIIIAAVGIIVLGGGGYGAASFFGVFNSETAVVEQAPPIFFDLPEMTVNLSTIDQRPQYLRARIALEMHDKKTLAAVEEVLPRVLDAFQVYLRELRASDLEGSAGIYRLKEELVRRINLAIHPAEIDSVVFKEIIVQ